MHLKVAHCLSLLSNLITTDFDFKLSCFHLIFQYFGIHSVNELQETCVYVLTHSGHLNYIFEHKVSIVILLSCRSTHKHATHVHLSPLLVEI